MSDLLLEVQERHEVLEICIQGPPGSSVDNEGEQAPSMSYTSGLLSRVTYAGGNYKQFTYDGSRLHRVDYVKNGLTSSKVFHYNTDGTLANVSQETL